jgi:Gluconate 2-dehydrogenase subunit 3
VKLLVESAGVGRREILQALVTGAGASFAVPALAAEHPLHTLAQDPKKVVAADRKTRTPTYTPALLDKHLFETLRTLAEQIVPGSTKARVPEFIDALLAVEPAQAQRQLLNGLGAMEGLAIAEHRKPWKSLTAAEQTTLLTKASTAESGLPARGQKAEGAEPPTPTIRDQFEHLKGWISSAYYSSEVGMRELGYTGNQFFEKLPECAPAPSSAARG